MGLLEILVLAAVAFVVLIVLIDRVVRWIVQDRIGARLQRLEGFGAKPDVSIKGFPFLTQAAARRFGEIHILGRDLDQGTLPIARVDITLYGVRPHKGGRAHADIADGAALVSFADLARAAKRPGIAFTAAGDDLLRISAALDPLGVPLEVKATSRVSLVVGNRLQVRVVTIHGLPPGLNRTVSEFLDFTVQLPGIPTGLRLAGLQVVADGIDVKLAGHDTLLGGATTDTA